MIWIRIKIRMIIMTDDQSVPLISVLILLHITITITTTLLVIVNITVITLSTARDMKMVESMLQVIMSEMSWYV